MGQPSSGRVFGACLVAAFFAALPTLLLGGLAILAFPIGFVIALGHALVLGLPAYLLLRRRSKVDWGQVMAASFLIGALPAGLLQVWILLGSPYETVGLGQILLTSLVPGVFGMFGGAGFRLVIGPPRTGVGETASVFE